MSDANESAWSGKAGRGSGPTGMTKGASVTSGLSEHSQISGSTGINSHGQGQRPSKLMKESVTRNGRKFKCE